MATITLKNIPEELHERLRAQAARNRRSLNGEILWCLDAAVRSEAVAPEELLARARTLRQDVGGSLDDETLVELKSQGRP